MHYHNPEQVINLLRDHLAAPDRHLLLLFGAGTSSSVNIAPTPKPTKKRSYLPLIPAVDEMTRLCEEAVATLDNQHVKAWQYLVDECTSPLKKANIESILGRLRLKRDAAGPNDRTLGLDYHELGILESTIKQKIAELASPAESIIPVDVPHDKLASWIRNSPRRHSVEIFTTNYDVLFERSLEKARVRYFDGFVGSHRPFFDPEALSDGSGGESDNWTRLWKIHGSTNWKLTETEPTRLSGNGESDMILPSHRKYDESRKQPYLALMDRFRAAVNNQGSLLVTCGYSWSDQHINAVALSALAASPTSAAIALIYGDLKGVPDLIKLAQNHKNLLVIGRDSGVIRGDHRIWAVQDELSSAKASVIDLCFDSDGRPEESESPVLGRMRLGDFNFFCEFLASMEHRGAQR